MLHCYIAFLFETPLNFVTNCTSISTPAPHTGLWCDTSPHDNDGDDDGENNGDNDGDNDGDDDDGDDDGNDDVDK